MARFEYIAKDEHGQLTSGQTDGIDLSSVRSRLLKLGWQVLLLQPLQEAAEKNHPVSERSQDRESTPQSSDQTTPPRNPYGQEFQTRSTGDDSAADLAANPPPLKKPFAPGLPTSSDSGSRTRRLPLSLSLRTYAEHFASSRIRRGLNEICNRIDRGEPLDTVASQGTSSVPRFMKVILESGLPPAVTAHVLSDMVRRRQTSTHLASRAALAMFQPAMLFTAAMGLWTFAFLYLVPQFKMIFSDFGTSLPLATMELLLLSDIFVNFGVVLLIGLLAFVLSAWTCYLLLLPKLLQWRLWNGIPMIGSIHRLLNLSELSSLMATFVENKIPLPESIRRVGEVTRDKDLQACCDQIAAKLEAGDDPKTVTEELAWVPADLEQILRWSSRGEAGIAPLQSITKLLELRAELSAESALPILEPFLIIFVGISTGTLVVLLFLPLIKLLNDLS